MPNCCGDSVGDSFMSCLFKLSFFLLFFFLPKVVLCMSRLWGFFGVFFKLYEHQQREDSTGSALCASTHVSGLKPVNGSSVCVCVLAHPSLMAREVFDPLRGGQARGLQSVKQIRLSLLRLVTYYSPT